jgi:hypothetical protein
MSEVDDHLLAETLGGTSRMPIDERKASEVLSRPAVWMERTGETSATYEFMNLPNEQAIRIVTEILPKVLELYLSKSRDYGGNVMEDAPGGGLGPKACFPDMWRKMGKLRRAIWDEQPMVGEQPDEILSDLIGHVLIILDERNSSLNRPESVD